LEREIKELIGKIQTDLTSKFETDIEQIKKNFDKDINQQNKITIEIFEVLAKKVQWKSKNKLLNRRRKYSTSVSNSVSMGSNSSKSSRDDSLQSYY